ncbi:MAG: DUF3352 domain-containing protein [Cyanobacteria bacterium]|nr:DUF3352 domain-containing protein [Cyanobacteriota bacterium]
MKPRPFFLALGAIAAVLLSGAIAVAVTVATHNPLMVLAGLPDRAPSAAALVPKDAPVMVSLLVNPDRIEALRQVLTPPKLQRQARQEWQRWRDGLLVRAGLDYGRDVRPWLGQEVTWALTSLDLDRDQGNGQQPGYLLVAETEDADRAREFLELFWQRQALNGVELKFERYKGVPIASAEALEGLPQLGLPWGRSRQRREAAAAAVTRLATALVGDRFVLLASDPAVLRDSINNVQAPGLSLAADEAYQGAIAQLTGDRVGLAVVRPQETGQWLLGSPKAGTGTDAKPQPWQPFDRAIATLGIDRAGLTADLVLEGSPEALPAIAPAQDGTTPDLLEALPPNALVAAAAPNLTELWQRLESSLANTRAGETLDRAIALIQDRVGLTWSEQILPWNDGPFALALLPAEPGDRPDERALGEFPGDWVFVTRHRPETTAALEALDDFARDRGTSISPLPLGNHTVTVWSQLILPPRPSLFRVREEPRIVTRIDGVRATVGDLDLFASSIPAMAQAIAIAEQTADPSNSSGPSLATYGPVARLTDHVLANPNDGLIYLDWPRSRGPLERVIPALKFLETVASPLTDRLDAIAFSSQGGQVGSRRATVGFRLSRL